MDARGFGWLLSHNHQALSQAATASSYVNMDELLNPHGGGKCVFLCLGHLDFFLPFFSL
jgi:hypothetical protein